MKIMAVFLFTLVGMVQTLADAPNVRVWNIDKNLETSYKIVYNKLEDNRGTTHV
ncbi:MAG: hypothetical protein BMS9Abin06_0407 [Gammaproteobacteria bacterium]|nr:MAG: hypothetical protein BMS9Abin06_0407 [Gammaproteobacteria bacterium]